MVIRTSTEKHNRKSQEDRLYVQTNGMQVVGAVFDGHGGHECADKAALAVASDAIPTWLDDMPDDEATENFAVVWRKLSGYCFLEESGSTVTAFYYSKVTKKAIICWMGDSPAFIFHKKKNSYKREEITLHTTDNKPELQRAIDAGGYHTAWYKRYIFTDKNFNAGLQPLRGLGDTKFGEIIGREPEVKIIDNVYKIIVATDGLLIQPEEDDSFEDLIKKNTAHWIGKHGMVNDNVSIIQVES